jgi:hypothetical protein
MEVDFEHGRYARQLVGNLHDFPISGTAAIVGHLKASSDRLAHQHERDDKPNKHKDANAAAAALV